MEPSLIVVVKKMCVRPEGEGTGSAKSEKKVLSSAQILFITIKG